MGWSPPSGSGAGTISLIESTAGTVHVSGGTGPTVDLGVLLSGLAFTITTISGSGPLALSTGSIYDITSLTGPMPASLPAAGGVPNEFLLVSRQDQSVNSLTVSVGAGSGDTIAGVAAPVPISPSESVWFVSDGVNNWMLI
jgi:hypothetical protein